MHTSNINFVHDLHMKKSHPNPAVLQFCKKHEVTHIS